MKNRSKETALQRAAKNVDTNKIISRQQAAKEGLPYYSTGTRCYRDHDPLRYTNSGACVGCRELYYKNETNKRQKFLARYKNDQKTLEFKVHPDDAKMIQQFVATVAMARLVNDGG